MKIHQTLFFMFIASSTLSCMMSPKTITGPDGTPHLLISCNEIKDCYSDAQKQCDGTYKIINTSNEVIGTDGRTFSTTNLLIKCD